MTTVFYGQFEGNKMVEALPVDIRVAYLDKSGNIMRLTFGKPLARSPVYRNWPSGLNFIAVPPLQEDPFEQKVRPCLFIKILLKLYPDLPLHSIEILCKGQLNSK